MKTLQRGKVLLASAAIFLAATGATGLTPRDWVAASALRSPYEYSSDAEGIRHTLSNEPTLDTSDAKFMLVACAAFISYAIQKALP